MRTRLLASMLVLLLSGADSGATAICAAYCMSSASAENARFHHHKMESSSQLNPTSISQHTHSRHHGGPCAECPPASQYGVNQKADCESLVQIQALKESSFCVDAPNRIARIDFVDAHKAGLLFVVDRERCLVLDRSQAVGSFNPASVPLRI